MIKKFMEYFPEKKIKTDIKGKIIIDYKLSKELMETINERKIPLVMDQSDLMITIGNDMLNSNNNQSEVFTDLNEVLAVHVTPIPTKNDRILTPEESEVKSKIVFTDPNTGIDHFVPYLVGNDTIHFTLNCVVRNHESGNDWDSYKYGVIVPLKKIDKTKILDVKSEDTYIHGSVDLEEYMLFCPYGEGEKIRKENPKAIVIEYKGITLSQAISCMIIYSGRKLEPYGTYGWGRNHEYEKENEDVAKLEQLAQKEGYPVLKGRFGNLLHSETKYMARRMWKREYEALINLIEYNINNNIDMPEDILILVMVYSGVYSVPGTVPVTLDEFKKTVFPILQKYGYNVSDSLFEGLVIDENMKFIYNQPNSNGFPTIKFTDWENTIRNRIINLIKKNKKDEMINSNIDTKRNIL